MHENLRDSSAPPAKKSNAYFGIVFALVWFIVRILIFPYMYKWYSEKEKIPLSEVPKNIPKKCVFGTVVFLGLNLYWWNKIIQWSVLKHFGKKVSMESLVESKLQ